MEVNGTEGVCALDTLLGGVDGVGADALAVASKFVGIGCVPHSFVGRVPVNWQCLSSLLVAVSSLAGKVGNMLATCRRQGKMSLIFVLTCQFW